MERLILEQNNVSRHICLSMLANNLVLGVLVRDESAIAKLKREVGDARFRKLGNVL